MEKVVDIASVASQEIADYAALGVRNNDSYFLRDDVNHSYTFIVVPRSLPTRPDIVMLARDR